MSYTYELELESGMSFVGHKQIMENTQKVLMGRLVENIVITYISTSVKKELGSIAKSTTVKSELGSITFASNEYLVRLMIISDRYVFSICQNDVVRNYDFHNLTYITSKILANRGTESITDNEKKIFNEIDICLLLMPVSINKIIAYYSTETIEEYNFGMINKINGPIKHKQLTLTERELLKYL